MTNSNFLSKAQRKKTVRSLILLALIFCIFGVAACRTEEAEKNINVASSNATPAEKKTDDFEGSLASVRTGNFAFVYAFRRTDADVFSGDDKKFLKANAPVDTNQWVLTADGKCVIAGSNYKFMPEHLNALKKRFAVEDYSPQPAVNVDTNSYPMNYNQSTAANPPTAKSPASNGANANQNKGNTK